MGSLFGDDERGRMYLKALYKRVWDDLKPLREAIFEKHQEEINMAKKCGGKKSTKKGGKKGN